MGGPSVYLLLLLVNKSRNCLGLLIGPNIVSEENWIENWEKEDREGDTMHTPPDILKLVW